MQDNNQVVKMNNKTCNIKKINSDRKINENSTEITFRVLLILGIIFTSSYLFVLVSVESINTFGGTIGQAFFILAFYAYIAPAMTIIGVILIIISFLVKKNIVKIPRK